MKEQYFTHNNIEDVSRKLLKEVSKFSKAREINIRNVPTALLVIDMQDYFIRKESHAFIPSAPAIISGLKKLTETFLKYKLPVFFTKHINTRENSGMMSVWWKNILEESNELSRINQEFVYLGVPFIVKSQYDAFHETELNSYLLKAKIKQLIITGVMTHLCCESTARTAFAKGYNVIMPIDGTATYNFEFHKSTFINVSHGIATLTTVFDLLNQFNGKK